jgi:hypothetical protein
MVKFERKHIEQTERVNLQQQNLVSIAWNFRS